MKKISPLLFMFFFFTVLSTFEYSFAETIQTTTTKSKTFMGDGGDSFTVANSGATVYGGPGYDVVTIQSGVSGVILDQNLERINFPNASSNYAFKQTGNKINIYDLTGTTLIVGVPVQSGGTMLSFSDINATALLTSGVMTLGGVTVSSSTPGLVSLQIVNQCNTTFDGSGTLTAPGYSNHNYTLLNIDASSCHNGAIVTITGKVGSGVSAASFDLYQATQPVAANGSRPTSCAGAYDLSPGSSYSLSCSFNSNQILKFGAEGNWYSTAGTTNSYTCHVVITSK